MCVCVRGNDALCLTTKSHLNDIWSIMWGGAGGRDLACLSRAQCAPLLACI